MSMHRRTVAACAAGLLLIGGVRAQQPAPRIALLSLIGDALTLETYRQRTGTSIDRNTRRTVPLENPLFDTEALLVTEAALRQALPGAEVGLLPLPAAGSALDPARLLAGGRLDPASALAADLRAKGFTQLVVVSKLNDSARLQAADGTLGSGRIEGLGLYVDNDLLTRNVETNQTGTGFLGLYVYVKLSRLDLQTGQLLREVPVRRSTTRSAADSPTGVHPMQALNSEQKFRLLLRLLRDGLQTETPRLFAD